MLPCLGMHVTCKLLQAAAHAHAMRPASSSYPRTRARRR
jgi:hypothetical protein